MEVNSPEDGALKKASKRALLEPAGVPEKDARLIKLLEMELTLKAKKFANDGSRDEALGKEVEKKLASFVLRCALAASYYHSRENPELAQTCLSKVEEYGTEQSPLKEYAGGALSSARLHQTSYQELERLYLLFGEDPAKIEAAAESSRSWGAKVKHEKRIQRLAKAKLAVLFNTPVTPLFTPTKIKEEFDGTGEVPARSVASDRMDAVLVDVDATNIVVEAPPAASSSASISVANEKEDPIIDAPPGMPISPPPPSPPPDVSPISPQIAEPQPSSMAQRFGAFIDSATSGEEKGGKGEGGKKRGRARKRLSKSPQDKPEAEEEVESPFIEGFGKATRRQRQKRLALLKEANTAGNSPATNELTEPSLNEMLSAGEVHAKQDVILGPSLPPSMLAGVSEGGLEGFEYLRGKTPPESVVWTAEKREEVTLLVAKGRDAQFRMSVKEYKRYLTQDLVNAWLRVAAAAGAPTLVNRLVTEHGANPSDRDANTGFSILHDAVRAGQSRCVEELLSLNAEVLLDKKNRTAFHLACALPDLKSAFALLSFCTSVSLQQKPEIFAPDLYNKTPLEYALRHEEMEPVLAGIIKLGGLDVFLRNFLKKRWDKKEDLEAQIEAALSDDTNRLLACCEFGLEQIALLIIYNCSPDITQCGNTYAPLHWAVLNGMPKLLSALLTLSTPANAISTAGQTPLHMASCTDKDMVKLLLSHGASCGVEDRNGNLPLHYACHRGDVEIALMLISRGRKFLNYQNHSGVSVLHLAVWGGWVEVVTALLTRKCEVNTQDNMGNTPLHFACSALQPACAAALIHANANLDLTNHSGYTALLYVCSSSMTDVAVQMIKAGANPNVSDRSGQTVFHFAAGNSLELLCWELVNVPSVDICPRTKSGVTILQLAAARNMVGICEALLVRGANIDAVDRLGASCLHYACLSQAADTAELLLAKGANPYLQNNLGKTPLDYAMLASGTQLYTPPMQNIGQKKYAKENMHSALYKEPQEDMSQSSLASPSSDSFMTTPQSGFPISPLTASVMSASPALFASDAPSPLSDSVELPSIPQTGLPPLPPHPALRNSLEPIVQGMHPRSPKTPTSPPSEWPPGRTSGDGSRSSKGALYAPPVDLEDTLMEALSVHRNASIDSAVREQAARWQGSRNSSQATYEELAGGGSARLSRSGGDVPAPAPEEGEGEEEDNSKDEAKELEGEDVAIDSRSMEKGEGEGKGEEEGETKGEEEEGAELSVSADNSGTEKDDTHSVEGEAKEDGSANASTIPRDKEKGLESRSGLSAVSGTSDLLERDGVKEKDHTEGEKDAGTHSSEGEAKEGTVPGEEGKGLEGRSGLSTASGTSDLLERDGVKEKDPEEVKPDESKELEGDPRSTDINRSMEKGAGEGKGEEEGEKKGVEEKGAEPSVGADNSDAKESEKDPDTHSFDKPETEGEDDGVKEGDNSGTIHDFDL